MKPSQLLNGIYTYVFFSPSLTLIVMNVRKYMYSDHVNNFTLVPGVPLKLCGAVVANSPNGHAVAEHQSLADPEELHTCTLYG